MCLCAVLTMSACGKKGNPLPPLVRVPAAPADFAVTRLDNEVFLRMSVPASNIDGAQPADVARIEVYAFTAAGPAPDVSRIDPEDLREAATLVATHDVAAPASGLVVRETLTQETRSVTPLPQARPVGRDPEVADVPRPLMAPPAGTGLQRYYFAVAVSPRGRYGPATAIVPAPLGPTSGPPSAPTITVEENAMTLRWTPPPDARGLGPAGDPDWLPARPVVPGPPPTTYDVYEVARNVSPDAPLTIPAPLSPEPVAATEFSQTDITLGVERCFYVRAVDIIDGVHVRGPASPITCAPFADTFAPNPPHDLVGVAVGGGINLLWEPSDSKDVAGYLVLRGEAGGNILTPLTTDPVTTPSYRDETVKSGVRYTYAVVAVDSAGNRSAESNRIEETAQ